MARQLKTSNIEFVQLVERNRCLYDFTHNHYTRKDKTEEAWTRIAIKVDDTAEYCKLRWKNLRTVCLRHLKKERLDGDNYMKPYYLLNYMRFLAPFVKSRKRSNAFPSSEIVEDGTEEGRNEDGIATGEHEVKVKQEYVDDEEDDDEEEERNNATQSINMNGGVECNVHIDEGSSMIVQRNMSYIPRPPTDNSVYPPYPDKRFDDEEEEGLYDSHNAYNMPDDPESMDHMPNVSENNRDISNNSTNSDQHFLLSFLSDMQQMNPKQKRKFKMRVINLINEVFDDN